jgi:GTP-binding protein
MPVEKDDPLAAESQGESAPIRLAFVGKPNVGKSSLVNRLLGEERVLVHDQPGTTRDPIDTPFTWQGREFVLVDTAGLRRRRAIDTLTEAVSAKMARDQLARADVVALVIDAQNGATAEDAKLASFIEESGRAALIVVNKGDLIRRAEIHGKVAAVREELGFMAWAPVVVTSAVTGRGTGEIPKMTAEVFGQWCRRVPTSELNKHFEEIVTRRPPPAGPGGSYVRLYYITQAQTSPPSFFVSANYPKAVGLPYRRYLTNQLRNIYGFEGSPLRLVLRAHKGKKPVRKAG